jgi:hypothetical protein
MKEKERSKKETITGKVGVTLQPRAAIPFLNSL